MTVIEVSGLTKTYGDFTAVDNAAFNVEAGEIFGILGPNGAGKTTTVESIVGLRKPDAGLIRVLGMDPHKDQNLKQQIGVQLQEAQLPEQLKVIEALELYASFYENPRDPQELLSQWDMTDKRKTRFTRLSGGQKQRLFIMLALVGRPKVAFLDELTTGLDPQARRMTWELIKQIRDDGVTVVLVSHFMDEVEELCDRVAIFDHGKIVALDTPDGLIDSVDAESGLSFRLPAGADLDPAILTEAPGVTGVRRDKDKFIVTGRGDFASSVTSALARKQILVADLRIESRSLDDAYVALTGRTFAQTEHEES